jgi:hypothetical protein
MAQTVPGGVDSLAVGKSIAGQWYDRATRLGGVLTPQFTGDWLDSLKTAVSKSDWGKAAGGDSTATDLISRLEQQRGNPMTLGAAQEVDEQIGGLIDKHFDPRTGLDKVGHDLMDIQSDFRDRIQNAGVDDTTGGTTGFDALQQGRQAWAQAMKMKDLERIQRWGELSPDNTSSAVSGYARQLLKNDARMRGWSDDEQAALRDVADRGVIGRGLSLIQGKMAPMAVTAMLGPAAGAATFLTGELAGDMTGAYRMWRLRNALETVGKSVPAPPAPYAFGSSTAPTPGLLGQ